MYAEARCVLLADPAEQPAHVPQRLGLGVHGVDEVTGEVTVSAAPSDAVSSPCVASLIFDPVRGRFWWDCLATFAALHLR